MPSSPRRPNTSSRAQHSPRRALPRWGHSQHPSRVGRAAPARAPKAPGPSSLRLPPTALGEAAGARPQGRRLRTRAPEGFSYTKAASCLIKSRPAVTSLPAHQRGSGSSARVEAGTQPCRGAGTHGGPGGGSQGRVSHVSLRVLPPTLRKHSLSPIQPAAA